MKNFLEREKVSLWAIHESIKEREFSRPKRKQVGEDVKNIESGETFWKETGQPGRITGEEEEAWTMARSTPGEGWGISTMVACVFHLMRQMLQADRCLSNNRRKRIRRLNFCKAVKTWLNRKNDVIYVSKPYKRGGSTSHSAVLIVSLPCWTSRSSQIFNVFYWKSLRQLQPSQLRTSNRISTSSIWKSRTGLCKGSHFSRANTAVEDINLFHKSLF